MIGIILLSYVVILLLSPKDMADYTVADTEYWRETGNRLLLKTSYEYNNKTEIKNFPRTLGDWKGYDFNYSDSVYKALNADILLSRMYTNSSDSSYVYLDIINSKVGSSFHKQKICLEGAGYNIDKESIAEFSIAQDRNPFTKIYTNRLDVSKGDSKQVVIYWFMFKKFGSTDAVTMIRLLAPVKNDKVESSNYRILNTFDDSIKNFLEKQLFYAMYERAEPENIVVAEYMIQKYGNGGIAAIIMGILIPFGLIFAGVRRKD